MQVMQSQSQSLSLVPAKQAKIIIQWPEWAGKFVLKTGTRWILSQCASNA